MNFIISLFPILFVLIFLLTFGTVVYTTIRLFKQERKNNQSPRLTVDAKVVSKRTNYRRSSGTAHSAGHGHTTYFVTFEVKSGDRMELQVQGHEYGMLVEGDWGELTFQGTRYLSFQRKARSCDQ